MLLDIGDDFPPRHQRTKVFLALQPPPGIARRLHHDAANLCGQRGVAGSQRPSFILHITLALIGSRTGRLPAELLATLNAALSMVCFPAFDVVLNKAGSFETRRTSVPFVLEGDALTDVQALRLALLGALAAHDFRVRPGRTYLPHMTLAYASRRSPRAAVAPFCWRAREVVLIESWVGATKYVKLASWKLWDDAPPTRDSQNQRSTAQICTPAQPPL